MLGLDVLDTASRAMMMSPRLWAYLDPGTGSMVLQVLLAGALSSAFFLKTWFRQVRMALSMKARKS